MLNLSQAIDRFLEENGGPDPLDEEDWNALHLLHSILHVCTYFCFNCVFINFFHQISFWYQQALSCEKTPSICATVAAFHGVVKSLQELQLDLEKEGLPDAGNIIQAGIDKVETYAEQAKEIPGYTLSIGELLFYNATEFLTCHMDSS